MASVSRPKFSRRAIGSKDGGLEATTTKGQLPLMS